MSHNNAVTMLGMVRYTGDFRVSETDVIFVTGVVCDSCHRTFMSLCPLHDAVAVGTT